MTPVTPWTSGHWAALGRCPCGATVAPDGFRDLASYREWQVAGLCQACQDPMHLALSADGRWRYPLRRGVVASAFLPMCRSSFRTDPGATTL